MSKHRGRGGVRQSQNSVSLYLNSPLLLCDNCDKNADIKNHMVKISMQYVQKDIFCINITNYLHIDMKPIEIYTKESISELITYFKNLNLNHYKSTS